MPPTAVTVKPQPIDPAAVASDEAKAKELDMARAQGAEYEKSVAHMAQEVADVGAEAHAGEMVVALAIEAAEGMYKMRNGDLEWTEPGSNNAHVEISVRDATDHRFIPGLEVHIQVLDGDKEVLSTPLPLLWHPWLYHYGANVELPEGTALAIEVEIEAPTFPRHDKKNGERYADDVFVRFEDVKLDLG